MEIEKLIDISDPVYTFCEVMDHIDLSRYFVEKGCRNDIRYMYLLDGMKAPSFTTFGNIIRNELTDSIEQIFRDVNTYIFEKDHVDLEHTYIDGTKIEANANRYTWIWKKSYTKNRERLKTYAHHIEICGEEMISFFQHIISKLRSVMNTLQ